ncbi:kelch repeat-containing protein [Vitiosangium sp. GDMCC 1.1324]|uniref:Kelch repeat-containing protein n=1 Tax=Vitiosangium sp. (strain GDMCC 1.1324) TaxID=2138576 RepID=UPI001E48C5C3|nr:kelch repeat-containing protein [Vitiosangium sp. GDMCC 1.1324]
MSVIAVVLLVGCNDSSSETGSARFAVSMRQALASSVSRVSVTSSAADIPSVTMDLALSNGVWGGIIGNIPAGPHRSFLARAFDASGTLLFEGSASDVTLSSHQTTLVAITLQQLNPPPPFENEAPLIDSLIASSTFVAPGGSLSLVASAHDVNPSDTLAYAWSATAGSFSSTSATSTSWTAPVSTGSQTLTLTVTDSRGLSSSISLAVNVLLDGGEGEARLSISFNSSPVVASLGASPTQLTVGQTTSVSVSASDPDGDRLSYAWSSTCTGTWSNAASRSTRFTPTRLPAGACNNCRLIVSVSDGRGGQTTGTVALCVSNTPPPRYFNPVIVRTYRSSDTATPRQVLTFEVVASDPQGADLMIFWEANTGALDRWRDDDSRSRATWTAPSCVSAGTSPSITVTVRNTFNLTATRSFAVTGLPVCVPLGSWAQTSPMTQTRHAHTATLLPNGKVLASGGLVDEDIWEPGADLSYKSAEVYDPATGTWSPTGAMSEGRARYTATLLLNGKVLVAGGIGTNPTTGNGMPLATAEVYDPATGTWSPTGSMASPRDFHTAALLPNGKVLVMGGSSAPVAELYDPVTSTWSPTGSMATPRHNHAATPLPDGRVLVVGGWSESAHLTTAEVYDPATGTWSPTGSMASPRDNHTATLLSNGKVLVAGGGGILAAELYDPATGTWSPTGSMDAPRTYHTATLLSDGKVLVAGGQGGIDGSQSTAEVYDPASGTWSAPNFMASPRESHTATLLPNGKVLVAGGRIVDGGDQLAKAELYTPGPP